MDRRKSDRRIVTLPATLTLLADSPDGAPPTLPLDVLIEEISGNGARVHAAGPLPIGSLVKLQLQDDLFLGEIRHSAPAPGGFSLGVHLDCALASLSGIRALMQALWLDLPTPLARSQTPNPRKQTDHQQGRQGQHQQPAQPLGSPAVPHVSSK